MISSSSRHCTAAIKKFVHLSYKFFNISDLNYIVNGVEIKLSERTRNFTDLINKNYAYKEKIKFFALNCFLEDDKAFEKLKFKTNYEDNKIINAG